MLWVAGRSREAASQPLVIQENSCAAWEPLLRGHESPNCVPPTRRHRAPRGGLAPPRPGAQHTKPKEGSKPCAAPTEGLLLSLQEMGIPVPGQSSPSVKGREANQITQIFLLLPPVTTPAELQCESGFVQREPKNRYKLNDFEVGHGPFD